MFSSNHISTVTHKLILSFSKTLYKSTWKI